MQTRPVERFIPNPKLKLREQLHEVMRFKQLSHRTEAAYWHWIKGFMVFHRPPTPDPSTSAKATADWSKEGSTRAERAEGSGAHGVTRLTLAGWRHPREMGAPEVQAYLSYLTVKQNVAVA